VWSLLTQHVAKNINFFTIKIFILHENPIIFIFLQKSIDDNNDILKLLSFTKTIPNNLNASYFNISIVS